jgi:hypothetical protein
MIENVGMQSLDRVGDCRLTPEDAMHPKLTCSEVLAGLPAVEELVRPARSVVVEMEAVVLVVKTCCQGGRFVSLGGQVDKR